MSSKAGKKAKEDKKLKEMSDEANAKKEEKFNTGAIYQNLDPNVIVGGMIQTISAIIEDVTNFGKTEDDDFVNIFFKDDRMFFLGILFLAITFLLLCLNMMKGGSAPPPQLQQQLPMQQMVPVQMVPQRVRR